MDKGKVKLLEDTDLTNAQYKEDLESMEIIELGEKVVVINPHHSSSQHVIKCVDFVRSNLDKLEFENPYNRNKVEFVPEDLSELVELKKQFLSQVKSIPHEIFLQLMELIQKIIDNNLQIYYFTFIVDSLEKILTVLPIFENINEAYSMEPEANRIVQFFFTATQKLLKAENDILSDEKYIEDTLAKSDIILVPQDVREIITVVFMQLVEFMKKVSVLRLEFKYTKDILEVVYTLEKITTWYKVFYHAGMDDQAVMGKIIVLFEQISQLTAQVEGS